MPMSTSDCRITTCALESKRPSEVNFFFQAEDGIRDYKVTGVQTCALQISPGRRPVRATRRDPRGARDIGIFGKLRRSEERRVGEEWICRWARGCNIIK